MALVEDGAPGKPAVFRPRRTLKWPRRWIVESGSNPTALQRQCSSAQHTSVAAYRRCAASLGTTSAWSFPRRAQCRALRIFFCSRFSGRGRYCDRAHLQLLAALRPRQSPLPLPGPVLFCRRGDRVLFPRSFVVTPAWRRGLSKCCFARVHELYRSGAEANGVSLSRLNGSWESAWMDTTARPPRSFWPCSSRCSRLCASIWRKKNGITAADAERSAAKRAPRRNGLRHPASESPAYRGILLPVEGQQRG